MVNKRLMSTDDAAMGLLAGGAAFLSSLPLIFRYTRPGSIPRRRIHGDRSQFRTQARRQEPRHLL
ncbi:hypothetical protein ABIA45_006062 [Bradyrhizobium sp. USDA 336]